MKVQIHFITFFLRFLFLVLFACHNLHSLTAFAAGGEKFYAYWSFGHDANIKIGNKNTKSQFDSFKAEHPDIKSSASSITNTKFAGFFSIGGGHYLGGLVGVGGYHAKPNGGEIMEIDISRFYVTYLLFLFSNNKGLFTELSSGVVMGGYNIKRAEDVTYTGSSSKQEYGYGASAVIGYDFKIMTWPGVGIGLNIQGGYNIAHSTALGDVTWNDYGASFAFSF